MRTECGSPLTTEIWGAQEGNLSYGGQVPQPSIMGLSGRSGSQSEGESYQTLRGHLYGLYGVTDDILSAKGSERGVFVPGFDPMRYAVRVAVLNDTVRVSLPPLAQITPFSEQKVERKMESEGGTPPSDSGFDPENGAKTGDVSDHSETPHPDSPVPTPKTGSGNGIGRGVSPLDSGFCPSGKGINHGRRATGESL